MIDEAPTCIQDLLAQIDVDSVIKRVETDLEPFRTTGELDIDALLGHVYTLEQMIFSNQEFLDCFQDVIDQNELNEVINSVFISKLLSCLLPYFFVFLSLYTVDQPFLRVEEDSPRGSSWTCSLHRSIHQPLTGISGYHGSYWCHWKLCVQRKFPGRLPLTKFVLFWNAKSIKKNREPIFLLQCASFLVNQFNI